ncbi:MAG: hypothetical protein ABIJ59_03545 [Pseudomonadota bacterium]
MGTNKKKSSNSMATLASHTLQNQKASKTAKSLAASVLSQTHSNNQTGAELEDLASKVLRSNKYNGETRSLAASVLSQSNKER